MALRNETATLLSNAQVGPRLWVMVLQSPEIAASILPGQFVHMKIPGMEAHVLRRPFSVYAADKTAGNLDILYQEVGFGSAHMTTLVEGATLELIGPVGSRWEQRESASRALLVGGGVGAAPLYMYCEELHLSGVHVDMVLGAATKDALVTKDRYTNLLGTEPACATDDGSYGHSGFCTALVESALVEHSYDFVACCGPEPLMKIVAACAASAQVPCQVSMEKRMACGVGACLSCVVDTVHGKKRACVDGPIFDAQEVVW